MKQRRMGAERIADAVIRRADAVPGVPLAEIAGDRRVLIENHRGIVAYGSQQIVVRVKFGTYCIRGCGLTIAKMSKDQLVVFGRIDSVLLERGC